MPLTTNGNHYTLRTKRPCTQCHQVTDQTAISCSYSDPEVPKAPPVLVKRLRWVCDWCDNIDDEIKEVLQPTDKTRLVNRLLSLPEEYDVLGCIVSSEPNVISVRIRLPEFDMSEVRAIQYKQKETGFITVDELIKVQRAGYNSPNEVPPRPEPRDLGTLRTRARQKAFNGLRQP